MWEQVGGTAQTEYTSGFHKKIGASDANNPWGWYAPQNPALWLVQLGTDPVGSGLVHLVYKFFSLNTF